MNRRQLLKGAALAGGATAIGALQLPSAGSAAPAGFPDYRYLGVPFNKSALRYNPTGELIFPCIRGVYDKISGGLGRYYLYYAPHEKPGGICLAYGNSLGGPFTEYAANPIISNVWSGHYSVSHVSSPHVIWSASNSKFYCYFHGENNTTRMAWSTDGVHYTYFGVVLSTSMVPGTTETSYARVFEHTVTGLGNKYVMLFMGVTGGTRKIFWGWSSDAKSWQFDPTPLVYPGPDGQTDISGAHLLKRNGTAYVVYHGNGGNQFITEVGNAFDREVHLGVFHPALSGAPDSGRAAAPSFGTDGGVEYMFYEAGQRLSATIAVARAV
ncbi:twin-arginine translocation signal domain-containing protein [Dactylosporangium sp. CS-033363]|uniref:twin-arginine translocation signal domain-containing protein n=1 Tax=Dactylosporangium sp. CS-033363 TaxID=3239935 RepID=UPI003D8CBD9F